MNSTSLAPRLSASIPTAPVPANTSKKLEPSTRSAITLKRVPRRRSLVGRSAIPLKLFSWRLRNFPAITRMCFVFCSLAHAGQMVPALPFSRQKTQRPLQGFLLRRVLDEQKRFLTRRFQQFTVAQRACQVKAKFARLSRPKKLPRTSQLQVRLGNFETVRRAHHGFESRPPVVAHAVRRDQNAVRLLCATADPPTQLVQLRKSKALGVLNHHHRCIWNVHANF